MAGRKSSPMKVDLLGMMAGDSHQVAHAMLVLAMLVPALCAKRVSTQKGAHLPESLRGAGVLLSGQK